MQIIPNKKKILLGICDTHDPAADIISKLALGLADDLLTTLCLASHAKLLIAPAMNQQMWQHSAVQANVASLSPKPFTVGFAAQTHDLEEHAKAKLVKKNIDMIIANDVSRSDIGFDSDDNAVTIISSQSTIHLPEASKQQIASQIMNIIAKFLIK